MDRATRRKLEDLIYDTLEAEDYERKPNYKGYEVYIPVYKDKSCFYPPAVFVKGEMVRLATDEEIGTMFVNEIINDIEDEEPDYMKYLDYWG